MKAISTEQMRELDRRTIEEAGIPGEELMERAGLGVAAVVQDLAASSGLHRPVIQCFAGRGNNGGDAFVAARHLAVAGFSVEVLVAGELSSVRGDALAHLMKMRKAGVEPIELATCDEWVRFKESSPVGGHILVDGILGTGVTGPPRGPAADAIDAINQLSAGGYVVSIDAPSGLNTDSGAAVGDVVSADITVTMAFPKLGLLQQNAVEHVGSLRVIDIGIPESISASVASEYDVPCEADVMALMGRRARRSHKGTYGHVLIIGGSPGFSGAVAMAAQAALRSGAGLVSVLTPESVADVVAGLVPEAMVHRGTVNAVGSLSARALDEWSMSGRAFDATLVGPGMGVHPDGVHSVRSVLRTSKGPVVLDADALNVCAPKIDVVRASSCPVILTPHPGELARLQGCSVDDVQADRVSAARQLAKRLNATLVLKGAGTVTYSVDQPVSVNLTGNPGMATAGMGDVLAGMIVALAGQKLPPTDAARCGVYLHGRAGDTVARYSSQVGMIATDVIAELPATFREVLGR